MICYACKKPFKVPTSVVGKHISVRKGDIFRCHDYNESVKEYGAVRLDGIDGYWLLVSKETFSENFSEFSIPDASDFKGVWVALRDFGKTVTLAAEMIANKVMNFFNSVGGVISDYSRMASYPNRRVVYLALHHRKMRIRKKNMARIRKYFDKKRRNNGFSF